ncbi:MAG: Beta-galactosidase [Planctomycetota bacterium]|jgi:hypothetical protein
MRSLVAAALACLAPWSSVCGQERRVLDGTWELATGGTVDALRWEQAAAVPGAFEDVLGTAFDGVAWYRRKLPLGAMDRGSRVRVHFGAVATHAQVFCNGNLVGDHTGGWTPFHVEIGEACRFDGTDTLVVRVDEGVGHNTQGFLPELQPHFGGIWQPVALAVDRGPVVDRDGLFLFGFANQTLKVELPVLAGPANGPVVHRVELTLYDGARSLVRETLALPPDQRLQSVLQVRGVRLWSPASPSLHPVCIRLLAADGSELDRVERRVGFRDLRADGSRVLWNQQPLQVRGVLHWGYSPPHLAPPLQTAHWRRQLEEFRSLGFNLVKCCLWVPPPGFLELCDEIGMLVWQEYPTWHPRMDQAHRDELLREYEEFFRLDRNHPSVAFRSITCETGHGADLAVVKELFEACKASVPDTLVVDDSSWIGWQRVTDFWDEHPYGNNRWWPRRLADFQEHQRKAGVKPLLLGECMAGDTWFDLAAWDVRHQGERRWWAPLCLDDQRRFEGWVTGQFGADTLDSLYPLSLRHAMHMRKYQVETLRRTIPEAGYVVSVARDVTKCRMGLFDDLDRAKWAPEDWQWHRDTMLCLETPGDRRAFVERWGEGEVAVRVAHSGPGVLDGFVQGLGPEARVQVLPGTVSPPLATHASTPCGTVPERRRVTASLAAAQGQHRSTNSWDLWLLPRVAETVPPEVRVVDALDLETLDFLEAGGRVYLKVTGNRHSLRSAGMWYLRGAPFAPRHPLHAVLPVDMLVDLLHFDLDGERLVPWDQLVDQVDPVLAFWETHDLAEVRGHLFLFDTRVGKGRLLANCLDHDTDAGRHVMARCLQHLATGPAPQRELAPATVAAVRALLTEKKIELPSWSFRRDDADAGMAARWMDPATPVDGPEWRTLKAGSHWENQAEDLRHFTGTAWYRTDVVVPTDWRGLEAQLVCEGIDDSAVLWVNGREVARFGDPATRTTVWLQQVQASVGAALVPGAVNTIVLRVVDHAGAGGLWKPVFLTTGPTDGRRTLLQ